MEAWTLLCRSIGYGSVTFEEAMCQLLKTNIGGVLTVCTGSVWLHYDREFDTYTWKKFKKNKQKMLQKSRWHFQNNVVNC